MFSSPVYKLYNIGMKSEVFLHDACCYPYVILTCVLLGVGLCVGASVTSAVGLFVYVLEHLQPGCPPNHVVIFEDDILCKRGLLDGVNVSHLHRLCGVLNQFHIC